MNLNNAGRFAEMALLELHSDATGIAIDTQIVMPDHVHAVIVLGTNPSMETTDSIPDVVRRFKMRVLKSWPNGVRQKGWRPYDTHLWQPSYHDTLMRSDHHLDITREYILGNPGRWIERLETENLL
jgi:REP element-mobilizing transposase RayT